MNTFAISGFHFDVHSPEDASFTSLPLPSPSVSDQTAGLREGRGWGGGEVERREDNRGVVSRLLSRL